MPIDLSAVQWDSAPTAPAIDPKLVRWDNPAPSFLSDPIGNFKADMAAIPGRLGNLAAGAVRGAGSIGATGVRVLPNFLGGDTAEENSQRRASMDAALQSMGADPNSLQYGVGKIGTEIAGTAGAGGLIGNGLRAASKAAPFLSKALDPLASAVETGGFRTGAPLPWWADVPTRAAGGAINGAAQAGAVNPSDAATGAEIGGALPSVARVAGQAGGASNWASMFRPIGWWIAARSTRLPGA